MTYQFPQVKLDKFEPDEPGHLAAPCYWCVHRYKHYNEEPCRTCDHNCCAKTEDESVKK